MSPRVITQEIAKNTNIDTKVKCKNCRKEDLLSDIVHEETLPYPHNTVTELFILCPACGLRTHSCYLPEYLRFEQVKLKDAVEEWHSTQSRAAYKHYKNVQKQFQNKFKLAQEKYTRLMQETPNGQPQT